MIFYHGVHEMKKYTKGRKLMLFRRCDDLIRKRACKILYRSVKPVLKPVLPAEKVGAIANVVFPTGIDRRDRYGK